MAVDRTGVAWVLFETGQIGKVDTRDATCTMTTFQPGQQGFSVTFGMGFVSKVAGGADETLYVDLSAQLAAIDPSTLTLAPVGSFDVPSTRAELTGTGDARLFALLEGQPYNVAEIDKATGKVVHQAPQNAISYAPETSNNAFAFWGGDFYLFIGPGGTTDVFHYRPSDGTTVKKLTVAFEVVGAGVSTCAPTTTPLR
jgi:hypothetical protein